MEILEKMMDELAEEVKNRVIKQLTDNASNMLNTFAYKVKGENIEGMTTEHVDGFEGAVKTLIEEHSINEDQITDIVEKALKNASFSVDVSF